jgi:hypothetical protein
MPRNMVAELEETWKSGNQSNVQEGKKGTVIKAALFVRNLASKVTCTPPRKASDGVPPCVGSSPWKCYLGPSISLHTSLPFTPVLSRPNVIRNFFSCLPTSSSSHKHKSLYNKTQHHFQPTIHTFPHTSFGPNQNQSVNPHQLLATSRSLRHRL